MNSIGNRHIYGDPDHFWDEYIQLKVRMRQMNLKRSAAPPAPRTGGDGRQDFLATCRG